MSQAEIEALNSILTLIEMVQEQNFTSMTEFFDDLYSLYSKNAELPDTIETSYAGKPVFGHKYFSNKNGLIKI
jgi:hypothetical protein